MGAEMFRVMRGLVVLAAIFFTLVVHAQDFSAVKQAAERGDAKAQYELGVMYDNGQGIAQDHTEAMKWFRKAAKRGYADAQNNLGLMYAKGEGVAQNYAEAMKWLRKAAEQGHEGAEKALQAMKN